MNPIDIDLNRKDIDPESLVEPAVNDLDFMHQLLDGIGPRTQKAALRSNCSQAVILISQRHPAVLMVHRDYFAGLMKSDNSYSKYVALHVLGELVVSDPQHQFDCFLDDIFNLLGDESVVVAGHAAVVAARIAQGRPDLAPLVIRQLLAFDQIQPGPEHRDLVAGYIIETLWAQFNTASEVDKDLIVAFVYRRQDCGSARTRKLAKEFLKAL